MKLYIKLFLLSLILFLNYSCLSKKKATPEIESVSIYGVGSVNFGRVPLGEYRIAGIKVINNTKSSITINYPSPVSPFTVHIASSTCSLTLQPKDSCVIGIAFSPLIRSNYSQSITVNGTSTLFTGQGTTSGVLTSTPNTWSINTVAGQPVVQNFTIYNDGDQNIDLPTIQNINDISVTQNNCGTTLAPGNSCQLELTFQRNTSGTFLETMRLQSSVSVFSDVAVSSNIIPSDPDGIITFSNIPTSIIANGTDQHTIEAFVPDIYSNTVVDGTACTLSGTNINFPNGTNISVSGGKLTFDIRSTNTKATTNVAVSCGNAFGQANLNIASGEPFGTITVQTFNNTLKANGSSSVTITTNQIRDPDGSVVDNGKVVYFFLSGPGSLDKTSAITINGRASVTVTSPLTTGSANLTISSNPIYSGAVITGYNANSSAIPIVYTAGYPSGTFPISCNKSAIFYEDTSDSFLDGKDFATCTVGPILDSNSNPVGAGYNVNLNILNGKRCSDSSVNFTNITNSSSLVTFDICGNSSRGVIQIEAESAGESVSTLVYSASPMEKKYEPFTDVFELYRGYGPSVFSSTNNEIKPPSEALSKMQKYSGDLNALAANDTDHIGSVTYSAPAQTLSYNFPRMLGIDCLQNVGVNTQILPCFYFTMSGLTYYWGTSGTYNIGYDGLLGVLNISSINKALGANDAHESYQTIFSNQFYNPSSDTYSVVGGFYYSGTSSFTTYLNDVFSQIVYPLSFRTSYDVMTYRNSSKNLPSMMSTFSTTKNETYLFGGIQSDGTLNNSLIKVEKDIAEDLILKFTTLNINPHATYGAPAGLVGSGIYYNDSNSNIYIIGGRKRVLGVWYNNDQIWRVNLSQATPVWDRVCDNCGLPLISVTNWNTYANFPLPVSSSTPTIFDYLTTYSNQLKILKNTDGKMILFIENGSLYEINLSSGSTSLITDNESLGYFNGTSMISFNQLTGRKFAFSRGSKTSADSKIKFFETPRGTKPYFVSKFNLDTNAKQSAIRLKVKISGYAYGMDQGSPNVYGMSNYIYDFNSQQWVLLGEISSTNELDSFANTSTFTVSSSVSNYVSNDNKVYILSTPTGTPSCQVDVGCGVDGISSLKLNYIELSGEF